jgi:hypothetical protein
MPAIITASLVAASPPPKTVAAAVDVDQEAVAVLVRHPIWRHDIDRHSGHLALLHCHVEPLLLARHGLRHAVVVGLL